jgi:hypothetical protein
MPHLQAGLSMPDAAMVPEAGSLHLLRLHDCGRSRKAGDDYGIQRFMEGN